MIHNDKELKANQKRIAYFQNLLLQLRVKATPEEFSLISTGYRTEILKMQDEVLEYLTRHSCEPISVKAVSAEALDTSNNRKQ
ncbi:MAG: hypothetical protein OXN27_07270 [Candidatus Poribacteria bacterium]|nr:hypothetical protein [Candidatus Poribacteria bacterium]MDE0323709.1 hypothetical protein [Candidatus Poribacteria bacterium]